MLVVGVAVHPLLAVVVGAMAFVWPWLRQRSTRRRARAVRRQEYPEVVDLLRVAVSGGANLPLAFRAVAERAPPSWRLPMLRSASGLARGQPVDAALAPMRAECPEADSLCSALGAAAESGTPLLPTLSRLADEARAAHRRAGEAAARRLPVVLLFPLIGCALPAFVLLTVVPLLAGGLRSLRL